ncbi:MAG TPA: Bor family protein [Anaeromyxobacteraceae bacterium]|nr:Bor family protein [Anaeromyxobacteraceae bacterium]
MKMRCLAALTALLCLSGCYTVSYQTALHGGGASKEDRGDFFLWGLVGEKTVRLKDLCPEGVSSWKSQATFVDGLLSIVTLGIYEPRHVLVECAGGTSVELPADDERLSSLTDQGRKG